MKVTDSNNGCVIKTCIHRYKKYMKLLKNLKVFQGGYMEAKKTKLEEQFLAKAASDGNYVKSQIFKGISIFVNGYTCKYIGARG